MRMNPVNHTGPDRLRQQDTIFMQEAIAMAGSAEREGEVPVGAIVVSADGVILAKAWNRTIALSDPCAHAEILALRQAGKHLENYRLLNTTLYVTVEPCVMCMGAVVHARLKRVVFGVHDPKWGAAGSLFDFSEKGTFNHVVEVTPGVCETECRQLLVDFFRQKREKR